MAPQSFIYQFKLAEVGNLDFIEDNANLMTLDLKCLRLKPSEEIRESYIICAIGESTLGVKLSVTDQDNIIIEIGPYSSPEDVATAFSMMRVARLNNPDLHITHDGEPADISLNAEDRVCQLCQRQYIIAMMSSEDPIVIGEELENFQPRRHRCAQTIYGPDRQ